MSVSVGCWRATCTDAGRRSRRRGSCAESANPGAGGKNRLKSFPDGVIAVAITLLVLGIPVPNPASRPAHGLAYDLGHLWPQFAAYVTSFITIGIIWINHHAMITRLREADHAI